jgi:hypothetical protein
MTAEWKHLGQNAIATNIDPIIGGIIDTQIVSGKWFVIPNNDLIPQIEDLDSKAEAFSYLLTRVSELSLGTESQFDIQLSYSTTQTSPRGAAELAFSVVGDRSGVYVEIFKDGAEEAIVEGEVLRPDIHTKPDAGSGKELSIIDDEQTSDTYNVVFTYSTIAISPDQALIMALDAIDHYNGGYVEVYVDGKEQAVFESEIPSLVEVAPTLQR